MIDPGDREELQELIRTNPVHGLPKVPDLNHTNDAPDSSVESVCFSYDSRDNSA